MGIRGGLEGGAWILSVGFAPVMMWRVWMDGWAGSRDIDDDFIEETSTTTLSKKDIAGCFASFSLTAKEISRHKTSI
jgi:hypothetical protein